MTIQHTKVLLRRWWRQIGSLQLLFKHHLQFQPNGPFQLPAAQTEDFVAHPNCLASAVDKTSPLLPLVKYGQPEFRDSLHDPSAKSCPTKLVSYCHYLLPCCGTPSPPASRRDQPEKWVRVEEWGGPYLMLALTSGTDLPPPLFCEVPLDKRKLPVHGYKAIQLDMHVLPLISARRIGGGKWKVAHDRTKKEEEKRIACITSVLSATNKFQNQCHYFWNLLPLLKMLQSF